MERAWCFLFFFVFFVPLVILFFLVRFCNSQSNSKKKKKLCSNLFRFLVREERRFVNSFDRTPNKKCGPLEESKPCFKHFLHC